MFPVVPIHVLDVESEIRIETPSRDKRRAKGVEAPRGGECGTLLAELE
jgi:hypothetical protein